MSEKVRHLFLVGGGHAHVAVLADWITHGLPFERATLLTPHRHLRYSGMVPGWIAGQYGRDEGRVDVAALAQKAGVQLLLGPCTGIDPEAGWVKTGGGQVLEYDAVSFDTGGVGRASQVLGQDVSQNKRFLDIRPIDRFVGRLRDHDNARRIAVIGGGAGGVELAFALANRKSARARPEVTLITGRAGLLPSLSHRVRGKVQQELADQQIVVVIDDARMQEGALMISSGSLGQMDLMVAALGSGAPDWPRAGGLAVDKAGFIAVDQHQRSTSHPNVFAVGDVASRQDCEVEHSGVHAVMAGPVLAQNLRSIANGNEPTAVYRPRRAHLYLMSTGNGSAILSYGPFAAKGRWVAKLKHSIDNRWISQYAALCR